MDFPNQCHVFSDSTHKCVDFIVCEFAVPIRMILLHVTKDCHRMKVPIGISPRLPCLSDINIDHSEHMQGVANTRFIALQIKHLPFVYDRTLYCCSYDG